MKLTPTFCNCSMKMDDSAAKAVQDSEFTFQRVWTCKCDLAVRWDRETDYKYETLQYRIYIPVIEIWSNIWISITKKKANTEQPREEEW